MIKYRYILIITLFITTCDKQDSTIEKPVCEMSVSLSGAINENWENEEGWFVVNNLYILKDCNQLSITLSKGYKHVSIVYNAVGEEFNEGTYPLHDRFSTDGFSQAEYYVLGSKDIYKGVSGILILKEIGENKVQGMIEGTFILPDTDQKIKIEGTFVVPPLY